jgi:hypothetical protein
MRVERVIGEMTDRLAGIEKSEFCSIYDFFGFMICERLIGFSADVKVVF